MILTKKQLKEKIDQLDDNKQYELKEYYPKRSNNQNALMWELISRIQDYIKKPRDEIYRDYIRDIGVMEIVPVKIEAIAKFQKAWDNTGIGYFSEVTSSKLHGYKNLRLYFGSSSYDTKEMAKLIDLIIQDCENLGIQITTEEMELLRNKKNL